MKTFAIINNYRTKSSCASSRSDTKANSIEGGLDWYDIPDSSILKTGNPFFVPDFAEEFAAYPSITIRIGRLGKSISARFSSRYVEAIGVGVSVVATTLLSSLRSKGFPWTRATAFDRSLWLGNLMPSDTLSKLEEIKFSCGDKTLVYRLDSLILNIYEVIELISSTNTLKNGDIILAGLTETGILLQPESRFTASTEHESNLIDIKIK